MEPASNTHRFPAKRIAVTVPPDGWFHGIPRRMFDIYRGALADLGFEIFEVPVDAFLLPNVTRISNLLSDLKTFQPELAFGLPKGSYALICRLPARRDGWRSNLFTEVLDIPTICLWDHAPLELADQLLKHAADPAQSTPGAREMLRRSLTHPQLIHWSPDTGQTQLMEELGFLLPNRVIQESLPSLPGFVLQGTHSGLEEDRTPSVGFIGHFYQELPPFPHVAISTLAEAAIQEWLAGSGRPLWYLLVERMDQMNREIRARLALDPDQTYFWHLAHRLILHQAQTALRLSVLGSAGVPVICHGDLKTDRQGVPQNLTAVPGGIPFGPELAAVLAGHTMTIDVLNPGSIHGYSHKPMIAFAAGGFMLVDQRRDFIRAFGEPGEAVSYGKDLGDKIERFLTNRKYLIEVREAIRQTIFSRFQLKDVLTRVLDAAFLCAEDTRSRSKVAKLPDPAPQTTIRKSLMTTIQSRHEWAGASVQHKDGAALIIAPEKWAYAAAIEIPTSLEHMREPHLRLNLVVEAGTLGIAALLDRTGALIDEQLVSVSPGQIGLTVELPHQGVSTVILRNTADTTSRARVLEASLCDRVMRPA